MNKTKQMALEALKLSASALEEHTTSAESNRCTYCCRIGICSQECVVRIACESAQTAINTLEADLARVVDDVEPLAYGSCKSLESARRAADEARKTRMLGMYPAACVVLDMQLSRLMYAAPQEAAAPEPVNAELLAALIAILPFIPKTSASDGGAATHSANVKAADKVRAAIAKAGGAV